MSQLRCKAIKLNGRPCGQTNLHDNGFCQYHDNPKFNKPEPKPGPEPELESESESESSCGEDSSWNPTTSGSGLGSSDSESEPVAPKLPTGTKLRAKLAVAQRDLALVQEAYEFYQSHSLELEASKAEVTNQLSKVSRQRNFHAILNVFLVLGMALVLVAPWLIDLLVP